jgi:hypothetical protein
MFGARLRPVEAHDFTPRFARRGPLHCELARTLRGPILLSDFGSKSFQVDESGQGPL